jgi:hypothetical protein
LGVATVDAPVGTPKPAEVVLLRTVSTSALPPPFEKLASRGPEALWKRPSPRSVSVSSIGCQAPVASFQFTGCAYVRAV